MPRPNFHTEGLSHIARIEKYVQEIEDIINKANKHAAQLAKQTGHTEGVFRWKDYPQTKKRIDDLMQQMHDEIQTVILNGEKAEWAAANKINDDLANYYLERSGQIKEAFGSIAAYEGTRFARYFDRNEKALTAFTRRKVAGMNLSQRVWNLVDQHKENLELGLSVGIGEGRSAAQISRDVRKSLNEPEKLFRRVRELVTDADGNTTRSGRLVLSKAAKAYHPGVGVYRSSYQNAFRLARTEINMAYKAADQGRWAQLDFVVGYKIIRSNNPYSCPVCESLTGNYPKNFVFTGWHPNCRCVKIPILKTVEEFEDDNDRIMRGQEPTSESVNEIKDVPDNFKKWVGDNSERIARAEERGTLPYFLRDNQYKEYMTTSPVAETKPYVFDRGGLEQRGFNIEYVGQEYYDKYMKGFDLPALDETMMRIAEKNGFTFDEKNLFLDDDSIVLEYVGSNGFGLSRIFKKGVVDHDMFEIPEALQGRGISKDVFRELYRQYNNAGIDRIELLANITVGGYSWAKYGFVADPRSYDSLLKHAEKRLLDASVTNVTKPDYDDFVKWIGQYKGKEIPLHEITKKPYGKDLLLGSGWYGHINLSDTRMRGIFEGYLGL